MKLLSFDIHFKPAVLCASMGLCGIPFQHILASPQLHSLDTIVVTATRSEKKLIDSPIRTEVISEQELKRSNALTLKDALENIPGVLIREIHGKSGYEISLQGMTSDQVLILIDGLPFAASTSSTVDLNQYLVAGIDHIEVIKGAASSQYGSSAMGGVINIITKQVKEGLAVSAQVDMGSYGKQNANGKSVSLNNHHEKIQIDASSGAFKGRIIADQLNNNGFAVEPDQYPLQGDIQKRQQYAFYGAWQPSDQFLAWLDFNQYTEKDQQRSNIYISPRLVQQNKHENIDRQRLSIGSKFDIFNDYQVDLKAVHETYDTSSVQTTDNYLSSHRNSNQVNTHFSSQLNLPMWKQQLWQLGYDWHQEKLDQNNNGKFELQGGEVQQDRYEFYAQNEIQLHPKFDVVLGWRFQNDQDFGNHNALKVSAKYRLLESDDFISDLRFSYGQGYRVPNLKERFYSFDHSHLGYIVVGNPNLSPESSDSYQLGFSLIHQDQWQFDTNVFLNNVKDLIQTDYQNSIIVNGITQYSYNNVAQAETYGVETSGQWSISPKLKLNAAYTYTEAKDKTTDFSLTRRPKHIARLGMDYQLNEKWDWNVRTRYQSQEYADSQNQITSPSWFSLDTQMEYQIRPSLTAFVGLDNLFDTQRDFTTTADYRPIAGRYSYMGLRFNWQAAMQ